MCLATAAYATDGPRASVVATAEALGRAYGVAARRAGPAVVSIYAEHTISVAVHDGVLHWLLGAFDEARVLERSVGSGMIVERGGCILTSLHVVGDADTIKVRLADGRVYDAILANAEPDLDVAVLQLQGARPSTLPVATLGRSSALEVGSVVLAIGAPFGLAQTLTQGIVSALARTDDDAPAYAELLQTDAPVNPGSSGGPLVDVHGRVVGINSAIATRVGQFSGVAFAVPIDAIRPAIGRLCRGVLIVRGALDAKVVGMDGELAVQLRMPRGGVLVTQRGGGLEAGDVIVGVDGVPVHDVRAFGRLVAAKAPGTLVRVDVMRDGPKRVLVEIGAGGAWHGRATGAARLRGLERLGLVGETLGPGTARKLDLRATGGVFVVAVQDGSFASRADLQHGDVIVALGRNAVADVGDLEGAMAAVDGAERLVLLVERNRALRYVIVPFR